MTLINYIVTISSMDKAKHRTPLLSFIKRFFYRIEMCLGLILLIVASFFFFLTSVLYLDEKKNYQY